MRVQYNQNHKILKSFLTICMAAVMSLSVFAADSINQGNIEGSNAGGSTSDSSTHRVNGGHQIGDQGYRIYIASNKENKVISNIIDVYFNSNPEEKNLAEITTTQIGGGSTDYRLSVNACGIQDMPQPTVNSGSQFYGNGENLKKWMLSPSEKLSNGLTNAYYVMYRLFKSYDKEAINDVLEGKAKLCVEGVYWFRPNTASNEVIKDSSGNEFYLYGTSKNIAQWCLNHEDQLGNDIGGYSTSLVQIVWPHALILVKDEPVYGLINPGSGSERLTHSQILENKGYGCQIYYSDQFIENQHTWDHSLSVPGKAPEMKPLQNIDTSIARPINIVKLYKTIHIDSRGNKTEKFDGCFIRNENCRKILVENEKLGEKSYVVEGWKTSTTTRSITDWNQVPNPINQGAATGSKFIKNPANTLYVLLVNREREPQDLVKLDLRESEISRQFNTSTVEGWEHDQQIRFTWPSMAGQCNAEVVTGHNDIDDDGDGITDRTEDIKEPCNRAYETLDKDYTYQFKASESVDETIFTTKDPFKSKINQSASATGTINTTEAGSNELNDVTEDFIIWRGDDIPTLASYMKDTSNSEISSLIGGCSQTPSHTRLDSDYQKSVTLTIDLDKENSDLITSGGCSIHSDHKIEVEHQQDRDLTYQGTAAVEVYQGHEKELQNEVPSLETLGYTKTKNGIIQGSKIVIGKSDYQPATYYPYIRMTYQKPGDPQESKQDVNILSQHISEMTATQAVQLEWNTNSKSGYSMYVKQDQWSNHATAIDKYGKNILIPGGAIIAIGTKGNSSEYPDLTTTLKLTMYTPYIPQSSLDAMQSYDTAWTEGYYDSEFSNLVGNTVTNLNQMRLQLYIDNLDTKKSVNIKSLTALNGIPVIPGKTLSPINKLTASTEKKYYLHDDSDGLDSNKLDISGGGVHISKYVVQADPEGNILLNGSVILKKTEGVDKLTGTAKTLDQYTKVISNFVNSLTRNAGDDETATWAKNDHTWYNEGHPGIGIEVLTTQININVNGRDEMSWRSCVVDPNLCTKQTGTADRFSTCNVLQYCVNTNNKSNIGNILDQSIGIPHADQLLVQQPFLISNVTVQEND